MENKDDMLLFSGSAPAFEIQTYCRDEEGTAPEEVHLIIHVTSELQVRYRFREPADLNMIIEALKKHRDNVWPNCEMLP